MTRIRQEISFGYHLFLDSVPAGNWRLHASKQLPHNKLRIYPVAGFEPESVIQLY
jgi:hypothetical protein